MALVAPDPDLTPRPLKAWWREAAGLFYDLFHSDELRERQELLARARAERQKPHREPAAPEWLRLD